MVRYNFTEEEFKIFLDKEYDDLYMIFTDNELPDINGIKIIQMTREFGKEKEHRPKIYMVSGECNIEFQESVLAEGADGYFTKPLMFEELKKLL